MTRFYWFISSFVLLLLIFHPSFASGQMEAKRVLVLYSEDRDNPGQLLTEQGIREGFRSDKRFKIQLYHEYLDVSRFSEPSHASAMADLLRHKYSGVDINAIITVYPHALGFLLAERHSLFTDIPIISAVITGSHAERLERSPARNFVTGVYAGGAVISQEAHDEPGVALHG